MAARAGLVRVLRPAPVTLAEDATGDGSGGKGRKAPFTRCGEHAEPRRLQPPRCYFFAGFFAVLAAVAESRALRRSPCSAPVSIPCGGLGGEDRIFGKRSSLGGETRWTSTA